MRPTRVAVLAVVVVLLVDLAAALAGRRWQFAEARVSVLPYFVYLASGFFAARGSGGAGARLGAMAAALAGVAHGTLGWLVAGRIAQERTTITGQWLLMTAVSVLFAAAVGFMGGAIGAQSRPSSRALGR
jgi:hypothetical protein